MNYKYQNGDNFSSFLFICCRLFNSYPIKLDKDLNSACNGNNPTSLLGQIVLVQFHLTLVMRERGRFIFQAYYSFVNSKAFRDALYKNGSLYLS